MNMRPSILLLQPPGWDACVSSPYASGPYLHGFLNAAGFSCRWVDLNIQAVNQFTRPISAKEAIDADRLGGEASNFLYFERQALLEAAAAGFGGSWTLREGFQPDNLIVGSSISVRDNLSTPTPYDSWLRARIAELIAEQSPEFIGISLTVPTQIFGSLRTASIIKEISPNIPVILGGNIPTRLVDEMSVTWLFDYIDILTVGQGEETLEALLEAGPTPDNWAGVPNIRYRHEYEILGTPKRYLPRSKFAQPYYGDVNFSDYWGFPHATIMAS